LAVALAGCSFQGEGLGSATSLGSNTSTPASTTGGPDEDSDAEASSGADASTAPVSTESTSDAGATAVETAESPTTESSGGGSSGSSSTGPDPLCGNGIAEPPEPCDGGDVIVTCAELDPSTMGAPDCHPDCTLDLQPCCDVAGTPCEAFGDDCCGECVLKNFQLVCQ
jgi:hypothetical protein